MSLVCKFQHFLVAGRIAVSDDRFEFRQIKMFPDAANFFVAVTIASCDFSGDETVVHFELCCQA